MFQLLNYNRSGPERLSIIGEREKKGGGESRNTISTASDRPVGSFVPNKTQSAVCYIP